jgi:transposase
MSMSNEQHNPRRRFTAQEKVAILREHLIDKSPVSQVCDKHGINPNVFYRWQQEFFEKGTMVFESPREHSGPTLDQRVKTLTDKLSRKDEVIAELMEEHLRLKKSHGEI